MENFSFFNTKKGGNTKKIKQNVLLKALRNYK
jgi:hypothetical protein